MNQRSAGILLHITSLPSPYGIGDLGPEAFAFVDSLKKAKQRYWQVLPLTLVDSICGYSPYSSPSAFAGNTLLISPDLLVQEGLLSKNDTMTVDFPDKEVNYSKVVDFKEVLLSKAFFNSRKKKEYKKQLNAFEKKHEEWLLDFALFCVIKKTQNNQSWIHWPDELRLRDPKALKKFAQQHQEEIEKIKFFQFLFFKQWDHLKSYCAKHRIQLIGDMPIYVSHDSVDVWVNPQIFKLDSRGNVTVVSGVPPDYFSEDGQRWGTPVYNWKVLKKQKYAWWMKRLKFNFKLYDMVRIDHFRAFINYWEIPAEEETARNGRWVTIPTKDFFETVSKECPKPAIIAEDLGFLSPEVRKAIDQLGFPGMKILLFAFGEDLKEHLYLPHNYDHNCVAYTGTHDNNTVVGWFEHEATGKEKENLKKYTESLPYHVSVSWDMIHLAYASPAFLTIIPLQDILEFPKEARMNTPGTVQGNWLWRFRKGSFTPELIGRLARLAEECDRL